MSTYSGRRAPNVSQYLATLNTVQDNSPTEDLLAQDDLSLFATTDFFDFEMGDTLNLPPATSDFDPTNSEKKQNSASWQDPSSSDFLNNDFQFPDLATFNALTSGSNAFPQSNANPFPIQQQPAPTPSSATSPTSATTAPRAGEKRKLNSISDGANPASVDEAARVAAEEDKRRRNTAASARFRIKKKQREQALEKTAKEMTDKASMLETKVHQLEMENKWLKSLITEKNEMGQSGFQELYEKFTRERGSLNAGSISEGRNDGVGTDEEDDE